MRNWLGTSKKGLVEAGSQSPRVAAGERKEALKTMGALATVAALSAPGVIAAAAPARAAAPSCWNYTVSNKISKLNVTQVSYTAQFRWCATNGKVNAFVVDKAYAVAGGWTKQAAIDIQPFRLGAFGGSSFDIYINVVGDQKSFPVSYSYKGITVQVPAGTYQDFWDISMNGNGAINGTRYMRR